MRTHTGAGARPGFTMVEMVVAVVLLAVLAGFALPFVTSQPKIVAAAAARGDALQGARFAQTTVDRELRMIGTGTLPAQPMLVYADAFAITFNADLVTRSDTNVWAVSLDPDADPGGVLALQPPAMALPRGTLTYPQAAFAGANGVPGGAETVSFWVSPDSSTAASDDYVLWRRVNRLAPVVVTTGVVVPAGEPFFQYRYVRDSSGLIDTVPQASLPLQHLSPTHGAAADTGETARIASAIDRVRTVTVRASARFQDPRAGGGSGTRKVRASTTLINVTGLRRAACGTAPDATTPVAQLVLVAGQPDHVRVSWTSVTDDGAGERDVDRYLIYRSENGAAFGEPREDVASVNRAAFAYTFDDYDVRRTTGTGSPAANLFRYAVTAQDCQPQVASMAPTAPLTVPVVP